MRMKEIQWTRLIVDTNMRWWLPKQVIHAVQNKRRPSRGIFRGYSGTNERREPKPIKSRGVHSCSSFSRSVANEASDRLHEPAIRWTGQQMLSTLCLGSLSLSLSLSFSILLFLLLLSRSLGPTDSEALAPDHSLANHTHTHKREETKWNGGTILATIRWPTRQDDTSGGSWSPTKMVIPAIAKWVRHHKQNKWFS